MRTVVLDVDLVEADVKPHELMAEYHRLLSEEVRVRLAIPSQLAACVCPGCRSRGSSFAFEKFGLAYRQCDSCKSMYVSPRPPEEALVQFYRTSMSSRFLRERMFEETKETRRQKIYRPRSQWLLDVVDEYRPGAKLAIIAGYHSALLVEELQSQEQELFRIVVANPIADIELADVDFPGVSICPIPMAEARVDSEVDVILAFGFLDRCADLEAFFGAVRKILTPGGVFLGTTTLISGFDLQVLWNRSETIVPPERLNLLSVEGLTSLCERHGLVTLEFSTPGMFDVETVQRAVLANPSDDWPRFVRYLVENRSAEAMDALQEFLQTYRLSSFARIVLRKEA